MSPQGRLGTFEVSVLLGAAFTGGGGLPSERQRHGSLQAEPRASRRIPC